MELAIPPFLALFPIVKSKETSSLTKAALTPAYQNKKKVVIKRVLR